MYDTVVITRPHVGALYVGIEAIGVGIGSGTPGFVRTGLRCQLRCANTPCHRFLIGMVAQIKLVKRISLVFPFCKTLTFEGIDKPLTIIKTSS